MIYYQQKKVKYFCNNIIKLKEKEDFIKKNLRGLEKWLKTSILRTKQYLAILRFNKNNVNTYLEYLSHLKNLILDDEDDERPGDYSSQTKGTLRIFGKIKEELMERLKFMKNIYSFLNDTHENFILIEQIDLELIDETELERMGVNQEDFSDLENIQKIVEKIEQFSLHKDRGKNN